jgi:hypothetical protein
MHSGFSRYVYTVLYIHISMAQSVGNKRYGTEIHGRRCDYWRQKQAKSRIENPCRNRDIHGVVEKGANQGAELHKFCF